MGNWKNLEELEECISLVELESILRAASERETRYNRFMAAVNGIDLDAHEKKTNQERLEEVNRRAEARLMGKTEEEMELMSVQDLGFDFEIEE